MLGNVLVGWQKGLNLGLAGSNIGRTFSLFCFKLKKMVHSCCVIECTNRWHTGDKGFFRIPSKKDERRRGLWLASIRRSRADDPTKPWIPSSHYRVCRFHFLTGSPNDDPAHPDYVPKLNMGYKMADEDKQAIERSLKRYERHHKRQKTVKTTTTLETVKFIAEQTSPSSCSISGSKTTIGASFNSTSSESTNQKTSTCFLSEIPDPCIEDSAGASRTEKQNMEMQDSSGELSR